MTAPSGHAARVNGDQWSAYDVGMCLQWVRQRCWLVPSVYGSAIEAWEGARVRHPGDRNPPEGAPCFYAGGNYGHVVLHRTTDQRGTDCPSSGLVGAAALSWPETAWGYAYLGWTEDLNGYPLPLTTAPPQEDPMPEYDHAAAQTDKSYPANEWRSIVWEKVPSGDAFDVGHPGAAIGGRRYTSTVHVTAEAPEGATLRLRTVEFDAGEAVETNPQTEALATSGNTAAEHTHAGAIAAGRGLRFQVSCTQPWKLLAADVVILSWPT